MKKLVRDFSLRAFTDNDYDGLIALRNTIYPDHPKTVKELRHHDKTHEHKIKQKRWVYGKNGSIIVCAMYTQFIEAYHPKKFAFFIHVLPKFQGLGFGAESYNYLTDKLNVFDPIKLTSEANETHERSIKFLKDRGYKNTIKEKESKLNLITYDPQQHKTIIYNIIKQGFRIITLKQFRLEDENADYKCWQLEREVAPDMPWTDPISIPEYDHYSQYVLNHPRFNPNSWFIVLDNTTIIGMSNLWGTPQKEIINTGLTGVKRSFRCKGIANALKHTSLHWAKNQGFKTIRTNNVDSNDAMLNINIRAGFTFMPAWLIFDKILKQ